MKKTLEEVVKKVYGYDYLDNDLIQKCRHIANETIKNCVPKKKNRNDFSKGRRSVMTMDEMYSDCIGFNDCRDQINTNKKRWMGELNDEK